MGKTIAAVAAPRLARRRSSAVARHEALFAYLFLLPWIIGFFAFVAGPMLASLYLSFHRCNIVRPPTFVGVENFVRPLAKDPLFWPSLGVCFCTPLLSCHAAWAAHCSLRSC